MLSFFIDNNKYLIGVFIIFVLGITYIHKNQIPYSKLKFLIIIVIAVDIMIPYFEKSTYGDLSPNLSRNVKLSLIVQNVDMLIWKMVDVEVM